MLFCDRCFVAGVGCCFVTGVLLQVLDVILWHVLVVFL